MPNIECELTDLWRSGHFANFDLSHDYWQLPLHREIQETQYFINPDELITSTHVVHWITDTAIHMQTEITVIIESDSPVKSAESSWLNDILRHTSTADELATVLQNVFILCDKH